MSGRRRRAPIVIPVATVEFPAFDPSDERWVDDFTDRADASAGWLSVAEATRQNRAARYAAAHRDWHSEQGVPTRYERSRLLRAAALAGRPSPDIDLPACCRPKECNP